MSVHIDTTPYYVKHTPKGWEVWQAWWNKKVLGPYPTYEEAAKECVAEWGRWK